MEIIIPYEEESCTTVSASSEGDSIGTLFPAGGKKCPHTAPSEFKTRTTCHSNSSYRIIVTRGGGVGGGGERGKLMYGFN